MVNAKLHIICGNCGCNDDFTWHIDPKGNCSPAGVEYQNATITCENCSTIHSLTSELGTESYND